MSIYTVPSLSAVDFALTPHTVPSIASPPSVLSAYTVPSLTAVAFALVSYTAPTYMDVGWDLAASGAPAVTGTLALSAEAFADATATLGMSGTLALAAEAYVAATGIGGSDARPGRRILVSFRDGVMPTAARTTGPLHLTLHRAPRGTTRTRR